MFDTFDRTGAVEFPFPPSVVFRAVETAVGELRNMTIAESNPLAGHLFVKTSASAFSWGEKVSVSVLEAGPGRSRVQIGSAAKTIAGSATTHGRNRKNIQQLISGTSRILEEHGNEWAETAPNRASPTADVSPADADPETRLRTLSDLQAKGLISDEEYATRRTEILRDI
jgi:hypothetical protein